MLFSFLVISAHTVQTSNYEPIRMCAELAGVVSRPLDSRDLVALTAVSQVADTWICKHKDNRHHGQA
jgi:hypothetical protein